LTIAVEVTVVLDALSAWLRRAAV